MCQLRSVIHRGIFTAVLLLATASGLHAFKPINVTSDNVALSGYDPVAYFTEGEPVKGSPYYVYRMDDAVFWFHSRTHRRMFHYNPERYLPRLGGYCTAGMKEGEAAGCDPKAFLIVNDKLYIFGGETHLEEAKKDPEAFAAKAEAHYAEMLAEMELEAEVAQSE